MVNVRQAVNEQRYYLFNYPLIDALDKIENCETEDLQEAISLSIVEFIDKERLDAEEAEAVESDSYAYFNFFVETAILSRLINVYGVEIISYEKLCEIKERLAESYITDINGMDDFLRKVFPLLD